MLGRGCRFVIAHCTSARENPARFLLRPIQEASPRARRSLSHFSFRSWNSYRILQTECREEAPRGRVSGGARATGSRAEGALLPPLDASPGRCDWPAPLVSHAPARNVPPPPPPLPSMAF